METKNIENNFNKDELKNSLKNTKNSLKNGEKLSNERFNELLSSFGEKSNDFIKNREDELKGSFEIAEFLNGLGEEEISGIDNILSKYLIPKNNIA
ncbi:hypothetical protein H3C61_02855 [Candidatus Gracilibacteria bacterium]|nr:hypothetical protein [Candidatus Gracilibacteria bacterium]